MAEGTREDTTRIRIAPSERRPRQSGSWLLDDIGRSCRLRKLAARELREIYLVPLGNQVTLRILLERDSLIQRLYY